MTWRGLSNDESSLTFFIRSAGCLTWDYVETEKTHTEHTQTSMAQWNSNPRSQERAKTVRALDRSATAIGYKTPIECNFFKHVQCFWECLYPYMILNVFYKAVK
jgi:hypothetical protein